MATLTKREILRAFAELASEKPVDKITVKEITDNCQISRNTFYYHYQDVYEVLEEYLNMEAQQLMEQIERDMNSCDSEEFIVRGLDSMISHRALFYNLNQSSGSEVKRYLDKASAAIFDHLVEIVSRDIPASDEDKALVSRFYQHAVKGFMMEWLESGERPPIQRTLHRLHVMFGENIVEALRRSTEQPE
ncbi:MAG: TetR/AcrR family transcriptional regulator C-terminal domain-containing protein [Enterocloster asparagiformis]|nr:TetR/AcrR family transcriptional regulator C-terminal domain-containing protein [Enterocloster asparagiformis]